MITSHYVRYLVALASCVPLAMSKAQITAWNDTGTNFNLAGSWTSGLPDSFTVAQFPVDGAIGFQPTLTSGISVIGLDFQGAGYTLGGSGTLAVGASGVTSAGTGTNTISAALATAASTSQTWNIGTGNTLAVTGALTAGGGSIVVKTGSGTLTLSGTSGAIATTLDIQGGVVKATTTSLPSAFALSNGAEFQIGFTGTSANLSGSLALGAGGGIISQVPANGASTRLDLTFTGSGDLELRGNTVSNRYLQLNRGSSGASANTGTTSITSGIVRLSGGYALGDSSVVSVSSGAELQIRNSETIGGLSGTGTVSSVGAVNVITLNESTSNTFSGLLKNETATPANTLGVAKGGLGTQTFSGANTYSGGTTVSAGTLLIANTSGSGTGTGTVTVNGGTFGGTGAASGGVTVASGAALQAGDGVSASGTLTLSGDVSLSTGSIIKLTLGSSGQHSTLARTGGVWTFASGQEFMLTSIGAGIGFYDNVITGLTAALDTTLWTITNAGYVGTFSFDENNNVDLTISAVPEPATWAQLGMAFFACLALFFRRRRQSDL